MVILQKLQGRVDLTAVHHNMELVTFQLKADFQKLILDGVIEDGAFVGDGCASSQVFADIMLGMIIGKTEEALTKLAILIMASSFLAAFYLVIQNTKNDVNLN